MVNIGADITWFSKEGQEWYFRDSYNMTNLAWVIRGSYWKLEAKLSTQKELFEKMAKITDDQIETYVAEKVGEGRVDMDEKDGLVIVLKEKRESIKENLPFIQKAVRVVWSV